MSRSEILEKFNIKGDKFDYLEMSEFLSRYIFDYLGFSYDEEIPTATIKT